MTKAHYYCEKCWSGHTLTSKIGKKHIEYARDSRIREKWTKIFRVEEEQGEMKK